MLEEFWRNEEDLERHLRSEDFRKVLVVVEMSLESLEIRFDKISRSTGVENIEKATNFPQRVERSRLTAAVPKIQ